jgi:hypothetical protein
MQRQDLHVEYRVQMCPHCVSPFDVYANYSGITLGTIWPHLFGLKHDHSADLLPYFGNSWLTYAVRKLGRLTKVHVLGAALIGVALLLFAFIPWSFSGAMIETYSLFPFILLQVLVRSVAVAGVIGSLVLIDSYVRFLEQMPSPFQHLLHTRETNAFVHWRNFTLCRLVGVQARGRLPRLTQIDIVVGGATFLSLACSWTMTKLGLLHLGALVAFVLLIVFLFRFGIKLGRRVLKQRAQLKVAVLLASCIVIIVLSLLLKSLRAPSGLTKLDIGVSVFDFAFWWFVLLVLGHAAWIGMSSTVYILRGLSRIPMRLSVYSRFSNARPLRRLQALSGGMMLTVFVTLMAVISTLAILESSANFSQFQKLISYPDWIPDFMLIVIGLILLAVGIGSGRVEFVYVVTAYVLAILLAPRVAITVGAWALDSRLIVIGFAFTGLLFFQFVSTERIIYKVLLEKRDEALRHLTQQAEITYAELEGLRESGGAKRRSASRKQEEQKSLLASLADLPAIFERIQALPLHPNLLKKGLSFFSPLGTAVLIQLIADKITDAIR